jgi:hypothetical protein
MSTHLLSPSEFRSWLADARLLGAAAFAQACFTRLRTELRCDRGAIISSRSDEPAYHDAHYFGFPDVAATMASWQRVAHLDTVSPGLVMNPGQARLQDVDRPEIAGPECAPLREHLAAHGVMHTLAIAVCSPDRPQLTVFLLVRTQLGDRYSSEDQERLQALAPLVDELLAINRAQSLARSPNLGAQELPVALASRAGALLVSTPAFARLMWPGEASQPAGRRRLAAAPAPERPAGPADPARARGRGPLCRWQFLQGNLQAPGAVTGHGAQSPGQHLSQTGSGASQRADRRAVLSCGAPGPAGPPRWTRISAGPLGRDVAITEGCRRGG